MSSYLALVLHAHLPFVRQPEHARFLEESWLHEAITDCYLPLMQNLEGWWREGLPVRLTLNLSPTLGWMLRDPLLQGRYARRMEGLIELAEKEVVRTLWQPEVNRVAEFYLRRFTELYSTWQRYGGDLMAGYRKFAAEGLLEIITNSATHAVLPLLAAHPPSLRAQIRVACEQFQEWFGHGPTGFWLPECAYVPAVEAPLWEAGVRWFIVEAHGLHLANPRPACGVYAPVITPAGIAVFGRDTASARQVWSRHEGYPGDVHYRDFYRDIGFDLDFEYVEPYVPCPGVRGFTGIKYHRVTGPTEVKAIYDREAALARVQEHAAHFVGERLKQITELAPLMECPPILVCPYDAELFGHWWFEGPEFLDVVVRRVCASKNQITLLTPSDYLARHPTHPLAQPAASSWGEGGHLGVWLNEQNHPMHARLQKAQETMSALARDFVQPNPIKARALRQAGRELLLAQSSDWAFMVHVGGSADYARARFAGHVRNFEELSQVLRSRTLVDARLSALEAANPIFAHVAPELWR